MIYAKDDQVSSISLQSLSYYLAFIEQPESEAHVLLRTA